MGIRRFEALMREHLDEYDALCAIFEDEALNSELSATVISPYLKHYFGYGDKGDGGKSVECDLGQVKLVFEHDIFEDGA